MAWKAKEGLAQVEEFKQVWPIGRLESMTLEEYTNLDRETAFIYWLESKTDKCGGIAGGSAFKFLIYRRMPDSRELKSNTYQTDGMYAWYNKLGETAEEVFQKVKNEVIRIATSAEKGELDELDDSIFGNVVKWKIAYLYNPKLIIPLFLKGILVKAAADLGMPNPETASMSSLYYFLSDFNDEASTLEYAHRLWYKYRVDSFYFTVEEFLSQAQTDNLKRKDYINEYKGLEVSVSFGRGDKAKVPWIALTNSQNKVSEGIYPVYLYYGEQNLLILAKGLSESNTPAYDWREIEGLDTIDEYFERMFGIKSPRYGASYVYKAYNIEEELEPEQVQEDLDSLITEYKSIDFSRQTELVTDDPEIRFWLYSPGQNASKWDEFYEQGIMALGWGLGDLKKYKSKESIQKSLTEKYGRESNHMNSTLANYEFANVVKPGDYIIAKRGRSQIIGYGIVKSDYIFEPSMEEGYNSIRKVNWIKKGNWHIETNVTGKTLTDVTKYPDFIAYLKKLLSFGIKTTEDDIQNYLEPYTKKKALDELFMEEEDLTRILNALDYKQNVILQGPPGVGKTFLARRLAFCKLGYKDNSKVEMIQFHQSYSYEDFIQGYRPNKESEGFQLRDGVFYKFCKRAEEDPNKPYFFIIDEINRGNLSKIFGELMMLIEKDKRGSKYGIPLLYSDDNKFFIPKNVYIIGTMNTADRSLALVDYALRRRFAFIEMSPVFSKKFKQFLIENGAGKDVVEMIISRIVGLNSIICEDHRLGRGFMIGHSYFCNFTGNLDHSWYNEIIEQEIAPQLREYWFDDNEVAESAIGSLL